MVMESVLTNPGFHPKARITQHLRKTGTRREFYQMNGNANKMEMTAEAGQDDGGYGRVG